MRFFMVALKDARDGGPKQLMQQLDKGRFPDTFEFMKNRVWLVAAASTTTTVSDLVDALAPDDKEEDWPTLFVAKADEYNGVADGNLWEKIRAWEESP